MLPFLPPGLLHLLQCLLKFNFRRCPSRSYAPLDSIGIIKDVHEFPDPEDILIVIGKQFLYAFCDSIKQFLRFLLLKHIIL